MARLNLLLNSLNNAMELTKVNAEGITRYIEGLVLNKCNEINIVKDAALKFYESVNKMYPLQIIRSLNSFLHLKYCDEHVLSSMILRNDMCTNISPKRAYELLTICRRLNISHPKVITPLIASLTDHMNNYVTELSNITLSCLNLNLFQDILYHSLSIQTQLNINKLNDLKAIEAISRYRLTDDILLQHIDKKYLNDNVIKDLNPKQKLYLLSTLARWRQDDKFSKILLNDIAKLSKNDQLTSTILTLMHSIRYVDYRLVYIIKRVISRPQSRETLVFRITSPIILESIVDYMECRLTDDSYRLVHFPYHLYMLVRLGYNKTGTISLMLDKVEVKLLKPVQLLHLLYSLALLRVSGNNLDIENLLSCIKSCYLKLNIREQEMLYDAFLIVGDDTCRDKLPSMIPLGYDDTYKLGSVQGKYILCKGEDNCYHINDSDTLSVLDIEGANVRWSPSLRMGVKILDMLTKKTTRALVINPKLINML